MCGLIGMAGDTGPFRDVFEQLLLFDSVRGLHSTGVGLVHRWDSNMTLIKRVGHPFNLFQAEEYFDAMRVKNSYKVMFGHNRHATLGEKTEENAHPFAFDNIMGMHNGTLKEYSVTDLYKYKDFGTDSEAIFADINKNGFDTTIKKLVGAWALIFYNKKKNTLNFVRNSQRPLHYCYSRDRCTIIWASELEMLKYVINRSGKPIEQIEENGVKTDRYYTVPTDTLLTWDVPKSTNTKFDGPIQTEAKGGNPPASTTYVYNGPFQGGARHVGHTATGTTTKITGHHGTDLPVIPFDKRRNTAKFRPPYKDGYGRTISKKEFFPIVGEGCALCGDSDQPWGKFIHVMGHYHGYHTPFICQACYDNENTYEFAKWAI